MRFWRGAARAAASSTAGLGVLVVVAACGATRSTGVRPTGFLGDLSGLQPVGEDGRDIRVYVREPGVLGAYDRFLLDPVLFYFHESSQAGAVNPEELGELAASLREKVEEQLLEGGYAVVAEPGPGVLRVRAALTDVDPSSGAANVAAKATGAAVGPGAFLVPTIDLGRAAIEVEMRDAISGERVLAFLDSRRGRRFGGTVAGARRWGHANAAFGSWAEEFRRRLDEVHGRR